MKAVPILAVTNALALGLVVVLYVQQGELETKLKSSRAASPRSNSVRVDEADLEARILDRLRGYAAPEVVPGADMAEPGRASDEMAPAAGAPSAGAPDAAEAGRLLEGPAMETFRRNVKRAIELNSEEDRLTGMVDRVDALIEAGKIGSLDQRSRERVATMLLSARERMPEIFRRFRTDPELRGLSREDQRKFIGDAMQALRAETQKELEDVVPAADAKTIMDESLRGMGMPFGGRGFGGGPPRR